MTTNNIQNNNNMYANTMHTFYIKQAYTENVLNCSLSRTLSVSNFIFEVKLKASEQIYNRGFSEMTDRPITNIDVVEAGQDIDGINSEDAPALQPSEITMEEKYGDKLKYTAFYVRYNLPESENVIRAQINNE